MILSPSLLSSRLGCLEEEIALLSTAGLEWVHWDIMDGRYVPNITFGASVVKAVRNGVPQVFFDVHLMIEEPERYIEDFIHAGANLLVIHPETTHHPQRVLSTIRKAGLLSGVALNPHTPLSVIEYLLDDIDIVLIMSVNPGFSGQQFIPNTIRKIEETHHLIQASGHSIRIQVDGGVTPENIGILQKAGAEIFVSGSSFFSSTPCTVEGYHKRLEQFSCI